MDRSPKGIRYEWGYIFISPPIPLIDTIVYYGAMKTHAVITSAILSAIMLAVMACDGELQITIVSTAEPTIFVDDNYCQSSV